MKNTTKTPKKVSTRRHTVYHKKEMIPEEIHFEDMPQEMTPSTSPRSVKPFIIFIGILLIIGGIVGFFVKRGYDTVYTLKTKTIPDAVKKIVGPSVNIKEITNLKQVSGVYEFQLSLEASGKVNTYTSYITKDGKIIFTAGTKVDSLTASTNEPVKKLTCSDVKKTDKPKVSAFVVANCPFGLQMQRVMSEMIKENSSLADYVNVKYIGSIVDGKITSMHGDEEAQENLRQICIREEQPEKYWPYVSCYMKKQGSSAECLTSTAVNIDQVSACMADTKRGNTYAQKDFDLGTKYQIGSSPTLLVNDSQQVSESDFGGRAPNAIKEIVCCAATNKPDFCGKDLSKDQVAASFSETVTQSGGSAPAANCGN